MMISELESGDVIFVTSDNAMSVVSDGKDRRHLMKDECYIVSNVERMDNVKVKNPYLAVEETRVMLTVVCPNGMLMHSVVYCVDDTLDAWKFKLISRAEQQTTEVY